MRDVRREIHVNLKRALFDYERLHYNTVVSATMKMLNALEAAQLGADAAAHAVLSESIAIILGALYPIAPHITHALWNELGFGAARGELLDMALPQPDEAALAQDEIELVIQLNGKLRGSFRVPAAADKKIGRAHV